MGWSTTLPPVAGAGGWTTTPPVPAPSAAWTPRRMLALAAQITAAPHLALQAVQALGVDHDAAATAVVELAAELHVSVQQAGSVSATAGLIARLHVAIVAAVGVTATAAFQTVKPLDVAAASSLTAALDLMAVKDMAAELAVVASTDVALTRYLLAEYVAAATVATTLGVDRIATADTAATVSADATCAIGFPPASPQMTTITTVGETGIPIARWADRIDMIVLGGGASGQTGSGALNQKGDGGAAGQWSANTVTRGQEIPWHETSLLCTAGDGGAQAPNSDKGGPNSGSFSRVRYAADLPDGSWTFATLAIAQGGSGTISGQNGASPGNLTYTGTTYLGGAGGTGNGGAATAPGGGGAGGNGGIFGSRTRGGAGARGQVWIRSYQI